MKSVPKFMQGPFRGVLKAIMEEVNAARLARDVLRQSRAWKAFLWLPRLLLHKPPRGGLIQKKRLEERLELFARGNWLSLLRASEQCAEAGSRIAARRGRPETTLDKLVQMGELSSGRQALEGAELAPGTLATLAPREPLPPQLVNHRPQVEFVLSSEGLCNNLRTSRRGAAAGPSGMTAEHLRVLLHCPVATVAFSEVATALARGDVPDEIMDAIKLGKCPRHRGGRHCHGTTILQASRGRHVTFSVCSFHQGRDGMRHSRAPTDR